MARYPGSCDIVSDPDDINDIAANLRSLKYLQVAIRRVPAIGAIVRAISPALDLSTALKRFVIGHAVLRENRQAAIQAAVDWAISTTGHLTDHFDIDDLGYADFTMRNGKVVSLHMADAIEGKLNRFQLTPEQLAALKARKDVWDNVRFDYNKFGGKLDAEEDLFPRKVMGHMDGNGVLRRTKADFTGAGNVATGGSYTKERFYSSADEGVKNGIRYHDIDTSLWMKAQEIGRRTSDEQLVQVLKKTTGIMPKSGRYPAGVEGTAYGRPGEYIDLAYFDGNTVRNLQGYEAPDDIVSYIEDVLKRPARVDIKGLSSVAQGSRELIASFDFGTTGVQLIFSLGADLGFLVRRGLKGEWAGEGIFSRAVRSGFQAWKDPQFLQNYFATNKDVIDRWASHIGGLRNTEYFTDLTRGGGVVPGVRKLERPFARAFEASLDVAKIEYVKALEALHGTNIPRADMESLGSWVRNMTGQLSSSRLGVSGFQQSVESTFLFFSPRYTRSLFGMFGAIFGTNLARKEAAIAIGSFTMAGLGVYIAAAEALGQTPNLDPKKPGFLSLNVNGNWIGIGGGVKAMAQLTARSYDAAREDPSRFLDFKNANPNDGNPILAFWKNRSAPLISPITTIWTGEDFRGTPIKSKTDWGKAVLDRVQPFALQAALEANGALYTRGAMGLMSGLGASSSPLSAFQLYDEYLKEQTDAYGELRFPDGARTTNTKDNNFTEFIRADSMAGFLKSQYAEDRLHRGDKTQAVLQQRSERLNAADELLSRTGDHMTYRNQVNQIRADSRAEFEALHLDEIKSSGDRKVVKSWYATFDDPRALDPVTGGIDSEGLEASQAEWRAKYPGEYERVIEPNETIGETEQETILRTDRKRIADSGWWDADKGAWATIQGTKAGARLGLGKYATYADFLIAQRQKYEEKARARGLDPVIVADILLQRDPISQAFEQIRTRDRLLLQKRNPWLVRLLALWGFNHVSLQEAAIAAQSQ